MKFTTWLIASLSGLSTIHAQNSNSSIAPRRLPATVVEASRDRATPTAPTPESSRKELAKTPGGTEVVEAERYLQGRASTVADTFALSPGVFAQSRFGSDEARLSIRGSGIQRTFHGRGIRVMQDGVPLNLADGGFDFQALDPLATSHIDVWRGANALAYGSSTLGGAINYHSRTGRTNPGLFSRLEAGSYGYLRGTIAGGNIQGSSDAYGAFTHQSQDGFRDHAQQSNQRLFTNFGQQLNDEAETRFYLSAIKTDSELPGSLTKSQLERDPSEANTNNVANDWKRDFDLIRLANKTSVKNGDTLFEVSSAWSYKDLDHPIFEVIDQLSNDFLFGVTATNTSELFGRENQLRAGVLYTTGMTTDSRFANSGGSRGILTKRYEQTATNLEGFVEDQHAVGNDLTVVLGTSASMNRRDNDTTLGDAVLGALPDYALDYTNISPKLGLRWDGDGIQAYTNISRSYEPPSFSESSTQGVARDAQTGTTFEVGTRGSYQAIRWDASIYHANIKDELLSIASDTRSGQSYTINADKTTHSGIELGTHADLLGTSWEENPVHRLVFGSAWTYGRFRFDDDATYGDNEIAGLPEHLIRGELLWQHADGWYAGPTFEWVPVESFIDHSNTFSADAYAICGFKFGRRIDDGISWFIEARNLTDEAYAATTEVIQNAKGTDPTRGGAFLPGDGRSVFAGIEWKW
jgi:iron complex outermembrane receptor protein